jgi:hypothetical protein
VVAGSVAIAGRRGRRRDEDERSGEQDNVGVDRFKGSVWNCECLLVSKYSEIPNTVVLTVLT